MNDEKLFLRHCRARAASPAWRTWAASFLISFVVVEGGALVCLVHTGAPWWILLIGTSLGMVLGLFPRSFLKVTFPMTFWGRLYSVVWFLLFEGLSELLAWWVIPQQARHFEFDLGLLLSIGFGCWVTLFQNFAERKIPTSPA